MITRKNQSQMGQNEWKSFIAAMNDLKQNKVYDKLVSYHRPQFHGGTAHRFPYFLPWHRQYLWIFEQELRKFDSDVTLPYWDWTKNRNVPDQLKLNNLDSKVWNIKRFGENQRVSNFENDILEAKATTKYEEFHGLINGPHGGIHVEVGGFDDNNQRGEMGDIEESPNDPLFWLHHCFIDKLWADWQVIGGNNTTMREELKVISVFKDDLEFPKVHQAQVNSVLNIGQMGYLYE